MTHSQKQHGRHRDNSKRDKWHRRISLFLEKGLAVWTWFGLLLVGHVLIETLRLLPL